MSYPVLKLLGMDVEDRVVELVAALTDGTTATADQLRGLTPAELADLDRDQPLPLPAAYRRFAELAGRGAGRFLRGSNAFYPSILGTWQAAADLLAENAVPFTMTGTDRVILMHQGYMFDFLRGSGPDPEVWSYCEGDPEPARRFPHFTDWLASQVADQTKAWARLVPWYEQEEGVTITRIHPDGSRTKGI
jgi:hypothetical protein